MSLTPKRDQIKAEFAARLSRLVNEKGWNQSDLARAASKHLPKGEEFRRDNVSNYLRGISMPHQKQLVAIAKALGVTPADLLPGVSGTGRGELKMPFSMRAVDGEPGYAWLAVDMKVSMQKASMILSLLADEK